MAVAAATKTVAHVASEALSKTPAVKKGAWHAIRDAITNRVVIAAALAAGTLWLGADHAVQAYYARMVYDKQSPGHIDRSAVRSMLVEQLLHADDRYYRIVFGPPCTGKTSLVKEACHEIGNGAGFVEVGTLRITPEAQPKRTIGEQLGNAIGYRFRAHATTLNTLGRLVANTKFVEEPNDKLDMLLQVADALSRAATHFKAKYGRPVVLVVDGVDHVAAEDEEVLHALLELGKTWAAQQLVTLVLVVSSPASLKAMRAAPAWHRAWVIPLPEASPAEAAAVLQGSGLPKEQAAAVAELVGGRFDQLDKAAGQLQAGGSLDDVRRVLAAWAESQYIESGIMDEGPHQRAGLQVVAQLLKQPCEPGTLPSIPTRAWRQAAATRDAQEALTQGRVFRVSHEEGRVGFDNRAVYAFARQGLEQRLAGPMPK